MRWANLEALAWDQTQRELRLHFLRPDSAAEPPGEDLNQSSCSRILFSHLKVVCVSCVSVTSLINSIVLNLKDLCSSLVILKAGTNALNTGQGLDP